MLEYGAVIWHYGLTKQNIAEIERVQKAALSAILGKDYLDYENALNILSLEDLNHRRNKTKVISADLLDFDFDLDLDF